MLELKLLLFAQGIRFLIFDYRLSRPLREYIKDYPVLGTLLKCPFCQGFWCGFLSFLSQGLLNAFMWGIGSGIISLTWVALVIPKIDEMEENISKENETYK